MACHLCFKYKTCCTIVRFVRDYYARFIKYWLGILVRYDNRSGAKFEDRPLVERDHSFMASVAIAWIVAKSRHASTQR